jgi:AcrR family transcriptional regulator
MRTDQPDVDAPARRGRGRPRDPATDGRITRAAASLLLSRGFDRTTVDDVASEAGVGKATVYRRWTSKEDLAVAALASLYAQEFPEPDTGSIVSDLTEIYRGVLAFVNTPEGAAYFRVSISESVRDERIAALYRDSTERRELQSKRTFERAIARGEVRADVDIDSAVQWLGGVLVARSVLGRPMPAVEEAAGMVDFTLRGVLT